MNSQHLAIHAKRVTINEKDTELLRDMIFTIDPTNGLGQASNERVVTRKKIQDGQRRVFKTKLAEETRKADCIVSRGGSLPKRLKQFVGQCNIASRSRRI